MRRLAAMIGGTALLVGLIGTVPAQASAPAAANLSEQVQTLLTAQEGEKADGAASQNTLTLTADAPMALSGGSVELTATTSDGSSVAFQRQVEATDGSSDTWITVATAAPNDGAASATVPVGDASGAVAYRAVSPDPGLNPDGLLPAGTNVSPPLLVAVTSQSTPVASGVTVAQWPAAQTIGSNEKFDISVAVTTTGGAPAAGVAVGFEYSADGGSTWLSTGQPMRDLTDADGYPSLVPAVQRASVTGPDGVAVAPLVAPTAPGEVIFRAVAGVNATPSDASTEYTVEITSDSLYNPPAVGTTGAQEPNTMPSQPGVLIKAQKLDPNGATVVDRPLQYPAVPANNPLAPGTPLVVPQVAGAGAPECFYRQDARLDCVVGSTDGQGKPLADPSQYADQYRILYSDKRFMLNPPPYTDEASLGGELGTLEAASALVFVPKNATAESKVVAWTHPTIGQEPHCSVTRGFDMIPTVPGIDLTPMNGGAQINAGDMSFFLEQTLAAGNIVVMPDYMGIGVNGPTGEKKSYMVGQQEARDVFYGVKALQSAMAPGWDGVNGETWTGTDFVVIGHSQGGHAAMWTGVESAKPWAKALGLNLKGVVAAAPATDLAKIVQEQWQGYGGWVLGPELIQTYAFMSPAFKAFAFSNNVLSPEGFANFPAFSQYCTTQAFAASVGLVNSGKNFLLNPAEHPQQFMAWGPVFGQQTPIITAGMQNSFPQDMPFQLISGTADNIVVSQINAAMQQSFCLVDADSGQPTVPMRAYWTPSMTGINTPPTSTFTGSISGDVLTVTQLTGGRGSQYAKQIIGALPTGTTQLALNNVNNVRVGDSLVGWGADPASPTKAPAGTVVTAIDYSNYSITVNNAVSPNNANVYFQPAFPGPLGVGTTVTWVSSISGTPTPQNATIASLVTGGGGAGTYQLDATPAHPSQVSGTKFEVQAAVAPPGGASPASNLQVPDHLNPLTFPFTQTEAVAENEAVTGYRVVGEGINTPRTVTLSLADELPGGFATGERFSLTGMPKVAAKTKTGSNTTIDINGIYQITDANTNSRTVSFRLPYAATSPNATQTTGFVDVNPPAKASVNTVHNNSASELLNFTNAVFAGEAIEANCHEVDEPHPTGLDASATGSTWYNFPALDTTLIGLAGIAKQPEKEPFYLSWGSAALPAPTETNPAPSLGLLFQGGTALAQSGCAFPWKPTTDFSSRPTNLDCNQYGLWPYGEFTYQTHNLESELWGVYPNEGMNTNIPAGGEPTPTPFGSEFIAIDPQRVFDSRDPDGGGPISADAPRTVDITGGGAIDLPDDATAVAYNITVTGQTASGYATVTPGNVEVAPNSSTINWIRPQQTVANGYTVGLDSSEEVKIFVGGTGSAQAIIDVVGYYAAASDGSLFVATAPARVFASNGPVAGDSRTVVDVVAGAPAVIPTDATGIAYNLTVTGTVGSGYLAVAPGDTLTSPGVSTVNWAAPNTTVANATQTAIEGGKVTVFAVGGSTNFFLDVVGYYVAPGDVPPGAYGSKFVPIDPQRAYDSRVDTPGGPLAGNPQTGGVGQPRTIGLGLGGAVPAGATGVAYNLTVTGTVGSGYMSTAPGGSPAPASSDINWTSGNITLANGSLGGINDARQMTTWVGGRDSTQYLVDVAGYFK